ncbi:MAG: OsmC family protein [Rhodohalobacter sp.]|uniref:OsmC family protein n=1 Tax=Rhodohalobacter sp. TaxID=1974210 RepID=UPI0039769F41
MSTNNKKIVHLHLGNENYKTVMTAGRHELISDEPKSAGGQDTGPDPYDYLLMSLGSCTVITLKMYADRKNWPLEDIYVEMLHHKSHAEDCKDCDDPKAKIDKIEKAIIIKGDLTEKQLQRLMEISKKCPVHRTLLNDIDIDTEIEKR